MAIIINNLTKVYGSQKALDNINLQIPKGEIVGLLGPNGAGKSTLMKIITCFIPQTLGSVKVCGYDTLDNPMEIRRLIGYLPEQNPLYLDLYIQEMLSFAAGVHGLKGKEKRLRIQKVIDLVGLNKEIGKKIGQLSKGYKQRVGLAMALIHEPEVLILDEPTTGLDPNQLVDIRNIIKQMGKDKTVILSTHILQEVESMCSRAIIINNGRLVADDSVDNLQKTGSLEKAFREITLQ